MEEDRAARVVGGAPGIGFFGDDRATEGVTPKWHIPQLSHFHCSMPRRAPQPPTKTIERRGSKTAIGVKGLRITELEWIKRRRGD
jgi:hypothetical protein